MSILSGSSIKFGLKEYPISEFELVAEELLMSDCTMKVQTSFSPCHSGCCTLNDQNVKLLS